MLPIQQPFPVKPLEAGAATSDVKMKEDPIYDKLEDLQLTAQEAKKIDAMNEEFEDVDDDPDYI